MEFSRPEDSKYELSRIFRFILIFSIIFVNMAYTAEEGIIHFYPFYRVKIHDLISNEGDYIILYNLSYIGRIIGAFICILLLTTDNRKLLMLIAIFLSSAIFFSFLFISNGLLLYCTRFLLAVTKMFFQIYIPIYIDQLGIKPLKPLMISISNITSPFGIILGLIIHIKTILRRYFLIFMCLSLLVLAIIIILSSSKYFSSTAEFAGYYVKDENNDKIKLVNSKNDTSVKYTHSVFDDVGKVKKGCIDRNEVLSIFKKPIFILSGFTIVSFSFIFDIIYIFEEKITQKLGFYDTLIESFIFFSISILGPAIGGILGGSIVSCVGGYEHKNSCIVMYIFSFFRFVIICLLIFAKEDLLFFIGFLAFYTINYMIFPVITGYTIDSLNAKQKGIGYSFVILICTILNNFPDPIYYKFYKISQKNTNYFGRSSIFIDFIGFITLLLTCYFRSKYFNELEKKNKKIEKEEEEEEMKDIEESLPYSLGDK